MRRQSMQFHSNDRRIRFSNPCWSEAERLLKRIGEKQRPGIVSENCAQLVQNQWELSGVDFHSLHTILRATRVVSNLVHRFVRVVATRCTHFVHNLPQPFTSGGMYFSAFSTQPITTTTIFIYKIDTKETA